MIEIVITYESEVLGSGEFWRGPANRISEIRNIPARRAAEKLLENDDGKPVSGGMWTASVAKAKGEA